MFTSLKWMLCRSSRSFDSFSESNVFIFLQSNSRILNKLLCLIPKVLWYIDLVKYKILAGWET